METFRLKGTIGDDDEGIGLSGCFQSDKSEQKKLHIRVKSA